MMNQWQCVLELDETRTVVSGGADALADAIRRGADLRLCTEFRHNEHIDVTSDSPELIREAMDFRITILLDDRWTAAVLNLRQPVSLPDRFGPRPSMSFFLYNQDGGQALARPYLDGVTVTGDRGPAEPQAPDNMPKFHALDVWDVDTNAPSMNFVYDFDKYRFHVRDDWQEMLCHTETGTVVSGSVAALIDRSLTVAARILERCGLLGEFHDSDAFGRDLAADGRRPHSCLSRAGLVAVDMTRTSRGLFHWQRSIRYGRLRMTDDGRQQDS